MDGNGTSSATPQIAAAAGALAGETWQRLIRAAGSGWKRCAPRCSHRLINTGTIRGTIPIHSSAAAACVPRRRCWTSTFRPLRRCGKPTRTARHLPSCTCGPAHSASPMGASPNPGCCKLELTQLALNSREAREAIPDPGVPADQVTAQRAAACSRRSSTEATRPAGCTTGLRRCWDARRSSPIPNPRRNGDTPATGSGTDIVRRVMIMQPPTRRRLRVFATDPGDSSRLQTSFVNTATVEVPGRSNLRARARSANISRSWTSIRPAAPPMTRST